MIEELYNEMFKYKIRKYELIFLLQILQALVTDCHEQAGLANGGERNCKGMRYRNTTYVNTTMLTVKTTFRKWT